MSTHDETLGSSYGGMSSQQSSPQSPDFLPSNQGGDAASSFSTDEPSRPKSKPSRRHRRRTVTIVGAGLVGALTAIYFAKRDWDVHLFDRRPDVRTIAKVRERSINMALSTRGLSAIEEVLSSHLNATGFTSHFVPMIGRMVHNASGACAANPYDVNGECIHAVDRKKLNEFLLDAASTYKDRIMLHFMHELTSCDLEAKICRFVDLRQKSDKLIEVASDLIVGADGAYSSVRSAVMRKTRMNFSQEYIKHGYCELMIPALADSDRAIRHAQYTPSASQKAINPPGVHQMEKTYLHIWPRQRFMLIAIPNPDGTFTATLFMPFELLDTLQTPEALLTLFEREFPDATQMIGREFLVEEFFRNPKMPLISIKCKPYHYRSSAVFLGDAAHAMVPFYGQGVNAGFEDVQILFGLLDKHNVHALNANPNKKGSSNSFKVSAISRYGTSQGSRRFDSSDDEKDANVDGPASDDEHIRIVSQVKRKRRRVGSGSRSGLLHSSQQMSDDETEFQQKLSRALFEFTESRHDDAVAICDLAMYNYIEMSSSVVSKRFLVRRKVEGWLNKLFPNSILPLYTMVSFTHIPYSECVRRWHWQTRLLKMLSFTGGLASVVIVAYLATKSGAVELVKKLVQSADCLTRGIVLKLQRIS